MKRYGLLHSTFIAMLFLAVLGCTTVTSLFPTDTPIPPTATPEPTETPIPTPSPTEEPYIPTFVPTRCLFDVPEGATVECGFVDVPEDRNGDPSDTVRLPVAVYRSTSDSPAPDPVIYLQGGPGSGSLEWSAGWYYWFVKPVLETRDFVFFDQRGTGFSEPNLDCWEVKLRALQDLQGGVPDEVNVDRYLSALVTCRNRLRVNDVNLAAYTSTDSAADVNDIVTALGYGHQPDGLYPVNLYGISYGTRLAQAVMRDFPEIVRSVVLDSVVPMDVSVYGELSTDALLQVLFDGCAADPACNDAYPDLQTVYYDLVEELDAEPVTVAMDAPSVGHAITVTVNGARLMNAALWALRSPHMIRQMPRAICEARDGNYTFLGYGLGLQRGVYDHISLGMMISVDCHDRAFSSSPEALDALIAEYRLHEALGDTSITGEEIVSFCDVWGAAPFDPRDGEPLVSSIPTLILAGEYDSTTPPLFGKRVDEALTNSTYFEFPGEGHAPTPGNDCAMGIALAFLDNPALEPDSACIAEMDGPDFVVP